MLIISCYLILATGNAAAIPLVSARCLHDDESEPVIYLAAYSCHAYLLMHQTTAAWNKVIISAHRYGSALISPHATYFDDSCAFFIDSGATGQCIGLRH